MPPGKIVPSGTLPPPAAAAASGSSNLAMGPAQVTSAVDSNVVGVAALQTLDKKPRECSPQEDEATKPASKKIKTQENEDAKPAAQKTKTEKDKNIVVLVLGQDDTPQEEKTGGAKDEITWAKSIKVKKILGFHFVHRDEAYLEAWIGANLVEQPLWYGFPLTTPC